MEKTEKSIALKRQKREAEQTNKLFIGVLNFETAEENLRNCYQQRGELKRLCGPEGSFQPKIKTVWFCHLFFHDRGGWSAHRTPFHWRHSAWTQTCVPEVASGQRGVLWTLKKLFVGIQQDTKEHHLRDYFEKYGQMVPLKPLLIGSLARKEALDLWLWWPWFCGQDCVAEKPYHQWSSCKSRKGFVDMGNAASPGF